MRIKWPNDIYSNGMKLGGVLCHSTYRQQDFHVVIGVGLNLDNSHPTTCINDLIQQRQSQLGMSYHPDPITREVRSSSLQHATRCYANINIAHEQAHLTMGSVVHSDSQLEGTHILRYVSMCSCN